MMKITILAICIAVAACSYFPTHDEDGNPIKVRPTKPPIPNPRCPTRIQKKVCKGKYALRAYARPGKDTGREFIECRSRMCFRCPPRTRFMDDCQACVHDRDFNSKAIKAQCIKRMKEEEKEQDEKDPICSNDSCPFCPTDNILYQYPAVDNKRIYCQCPQRMNPILRIYPSPVCNICPPGTVFEQPEVLKTGCCVVPGQGHQ